MFVALTPIRMSFQSSFNDTIGSMIGMATLNDHNKKTIRILKAIPKFWSLFTGRNRSQRLDNIFAGSNVNLTGFGIVFSIIDTFTIHL